MGDQPGTFAVLSAKESIDAAIATSTAPHSDSPELPICPACDLETPDTHAQAHAGPHSKIWTAAEDKGFGGLRAVGTFEELGGALNIFFVVLILIGTRTVLLMKVSSGV